MMIRFSSLFLEIGFGLVGLFVFGQAARSDVPQALTSPDGRIAVQFAMPTPNSAEVPRWSATFRGKPILNDCRVSLEAAIIGDLAAGVRVQSEKRRASNQHVRVLFGKTALAQDRFHEARFALENAQHRRFDLVFRCYDDAVAFRYEVPEQAGFDTLTITDEKTSFHLEGNPLAYVQYLENYQTSHEHTVNAVAVQDIKPETLLDMPLTLRRQDGIFLAITEASLRRYAGMGLMRPADAKDKGELVCKLTPHPDGTKVVRLLPMQTPWRVVLVGERAGSLLESNTLYCLNEPNATGDTKWITPGKITFSWWNGNVVKDGKPEPPIFSMEAQKLYIDFCAANHIRYHSVICDNSDTPWYKQTQKGVAPGADTDVTQVRADLDLAGIRRYAESKGVYLWTWVHSAALRGRVEEAFAAFERFGWHGMMVDFFDHDDQENVEFAEEILQAAARHHILIHLHGIWKPTGWQRTYPNLVNHEGALNLEYLKWSELCTPEHTLNLLFTRMVAGPMDYHAGGFRSVPRADFKPIYVAPNVLGTRCFMLASYVCFDNPNPMLADYPGAYEGQSGFDFLQLVPTYWDETRILQGEVGEILVTARRKGRVWYVGGMAAKTARELELPLGFLGKGNYTAKIWKDAPDSEANPNHLVTETITTASDKTLRVHLAVDGGFAAQFTPVR